MSLAHAAYPSHATLAGSQFSADPGLDQSVQTTTQDDGWDATGVLIFATSLLTLGGSGVFLLLRVAGLT